MLEDHIVLSASWGDTLMLKSNSEPLKLTQRLSVSTNPPEVKSWPATERLWLIQDCWSRPKSQILKFLLLLALTTIQGNRN